jgi:hypothetical protein
MKKVLAALLILALVAPAFAVTISGTDLTGGKMRLSYNVPAGEVLRGVALKLSTTAGTATIADTGKVTAINSAFDVFIDYAFSQPTGFTVAPRVGHPLANPAAAGELTGFPASTFSLSMGVLDQAGAQAGVTGSGVLCEIQYAITGASATVKVEADTLRGGAVVGDAVTQPTTANVTLVNGFTLTTSVGTPSGTVTVPGVGVYPNLTGVQTITAVPTAGYNFVNWTGNTANIANVNAASTTINMIADAAIVANFTLAEAITTPSVAKTTIAPAIASRVNSGRLETFVASGAVDNLGHAMEYQFTWGDGNVSTWGAATQTKTYTYAAAATYNVTVQARCIAHPTVLSAASAVLAETTEEFSSSIDATAYTAWALFNRPICWAYNRNCRGDANGRKVGLYTVQAHDLNALKAGFSKQDSALQTITYDPDGTGTLPPIPGICADFNKTKVGLYRVQANDLTVLKTYYSKQDTAVPVCAPGAGDSHGIIYYTTAQ